MINKNKLDKELFEKSLLLNAIHEKIKMTFQDLRRFSFDEDDEVIIQFTRQEILSEEEKFKKIMPEIYNLLDQLEILTKWNVKNIFDDKKTTVDRPRERVHKYRKKRAKNE